VTGSNKRAQKTKALTSFQSLMGCGQGSQPSARFGRLDFVRYAARGRPGRAPGGFGSVTPRVVVSDVAAEVAFLRAVFDATGDVQADHPSNRSALGDSRMLFSAAGERELFPTFLLAVDYGNLLPDRTPTTNGQLLKIHTRPEADCMTKQLPNPDDEPRSAVG
jgi:hypothetical protein